MRYHIYESETFDEHVLVSEKSQEDWIVEGLERIHTFEVETPHKDALSYLDAPSYIRAKAYTHEYLGWERYNPMIPEGAGKETIQIIEEEVEAGIEKCRN